MGPLEAEVRARFQTPRPSRWWHALPQERSASALATAFRKLLDSTRRG
jgi:hypothetical protein